MWQVPVVCVVVVGVVEAADVAVSGVSALRACSTGCVVFIVTRCMGPVSGGHCVLSLSSVTHLVGVLGVWQAAGKVLSATWWHYQQRVAAHHRYKCP